LAGHNVQDLTLQVLGWRKIPAHGVREEICRLMAVDVLHDDIFQLMVADGKVSITCAMLATQLNGMITSGQLVKMDVMKVNKYIFPKFSKKPVLVISDVTVLKTPQDVGAVIGNLSRFDRSLYNDWSVQFEEHKAFASWGWAPAENATSGPSRSNSSDLLGDVKSEPKVIHQYTQTDDEDAKPSPAKSQNTPASDKQNKSKHKAEDDTTEPPKKSVVLDERSSRIS